MAQVYIWSEASGGQQSLEGPFDANSLTQEQQERVDDGDAEILEAGEVTAAELALLGNTGRIERDTAVPDELVSMGDAAGVARPEDLTEDNMQDYPETHNEPWEAYYEAVGQHYPHLMLGALSDTL